MSERPKPRKFGDSGTHTRINTNGAWLYLPPWAPIHIKLTRVCTPIQSHINRQDLLSDLASEAPSLAPELSQEDWVAAFGTTLIVSAVHSPPPRTQLFQRHNQAKMAALRVWRARWLALLWVLTEVGHHQLPSVTI